MSGGAFGYRYLPVTLVLIGTVVGLRYSHSRQRCICPATCSIINSSDPGASNVIDSVYIPLPYMSSDGRYVGHQPSDNVINRIGQSKRSRKVVCRTL